MANKHMKSYSTLQVIKEMQINTTITCHCTPVRMAKILKPDHIKGCPGYGATGTHTSGTTTLKNSFLKKRNI